MTSGAPRQTNLAFRQDPERSSTLPGTYYFDPTIYTREQEAIWFATWQYVGNREDLKQPGDYITATIIDQPILVVRGKDNRLRAYYNTCMHRGHLLAEGKGNKRILTCPFHAWSYDLEGQLKAAGNAENVAGFRYEDFGLVEIRVEEFGPMVFVNLSPEGPSLMSMASGLLDSFRGAVPQFDDLVWTRTDSFEIKGNWKFMIDGMECYHCPVIHPQLMGKDGYAEPSWESIEDKYWSAHIIRGRYELMDTQRDKLHYDMGNAEIRDVWVWFMWPNMVFVSHQGPSNFKILQAQATGPATSRRNIINLCRTNPPTATDLANMNNYAYEIFPQDIQAIEAQAAGVRARGYTRGRLMVDRERSWRSEHGTHHFDDLVWRALNGDHYE